MELAESEKRWLRYTKSSLCLCMKRARVRSAAEKDAGAGPAMAVGGWTHALVVGVSNYQNTPLRYPAKDAQDISRELRQRVNCQVTTCLDPTRDMLEQELNRFCANLPSGTGVIFYFAGHGAIQHSTNKHYLICRESNSTADSNKPQVKIEPFNTEPTYLQPTSDRSLQKEAIATPTIIEQIAAAVGEHGSVVAFLDSCRSISYRDASTTTSSTGPTGDLLTAFSTHKELELKKVTLELAIQQQQLLLQQLMNGIEASNSNSSPSQQLCGQFTPKLICHACGQGRCATEGGPGLQNGWYTHCLLEHLFKPQHPDLFSAVCAANRYYVTRFRREAPDMTIPVGDILPFQKPLVGLPPSQTLPKSQASSKVTSIEVENISAAQLNKHGKYGKTASGSSSKTPVVGPSSAVKHTTVPFDVPNNNLGAKHESDGQQPLTPPATAALPNSTLGCSTKSPSYSGVGGYNCLPTNNPQLSLLMPSTPLAAPAAQPGFASGSAATASSSSSQSKPIKWCGQEVALLNQQQILQTPGGAAAAAAYQQLKLQEPSIQIDFSNQGKIIVELHSDVTPAGVLSAASGSIAALQDWSKASHTVVITGGSNISCKRRPAFWFDLWLAVGPRFCAQIRSLDLAFAALGDAGVDAFSAKASPHMTSLISLDLSYNMISNVGVQALACKGAGYLTQLLQLNLDGNLIDDDGAAVLAQTAAPYWRNMQLLQLNGNRLTQQGAEQIRAAAEQYWPRPNSAVATAPSSVTAGNTSSSTGTWAALAGAAATQLGAAVSFSASAADFPANHSVPPGRQGAAVHSPGVAEAAAAVAKKKQKKSAHLGEADVTTTLKRMTVNEIKEWFMERLTSINDEGEVQRFMQFCSTKPKKEDLRTYVKEGATRLNFRQQ